VEGGGWGTRGKVCEGACQLSDMEGNVGTSGIMRSQIPDIRESMQRCLSAQ